MNDTTDRTIHARIHDGAIKRVTRTFAATIADGFSEILQNSRRGPAPRACASPLPGPMATSR